MLCTALSTATRSRLVLREYNVDLIERFIEKEVDNVQCYAFDVS
jgi:hypothetical protein